MHPLRVILALPPEDRRRAIEVAVEGLDGVELVGSLEQFDQIPALLDTLRSTRQNEDEERAPVLIIDLEGSSSLETIRNLKDHAVYRRAPILGLVDGSHSEGIDAAYRAHVNACIPYYGSEEEATEHLLTCLRFFRDLTQLPPFEA